MRSEEWAMKENMRLYPTSWKIGYSKGKNRCIIQVDQQKRTKMPNAIIQLILMKGQFKDVVKYLSNEFRLYERRKGKS